MTESNPDDDTLHTVHEDLTAGFAEMRSGFADLKGEIRSGFGDLKATLIAGFRSLPSRESSEEMVRLLREGNRLNEERFTHLDLRIREQHLETQQVQHALVESQRLLTDGQRLLVEGQRSLSADIKALIARIDALIKGRRNGDPGA
jgi:hypothetical protein